MDLQQRGVASFLQRQDSTQLLRDRFNTRKLIVAVSSTGKVVWCGCGRGRGVMVGVVLWWAWCYGGCGVMVGVVLWWVCCYSGWM